jgi:hypothetical protein
MRVFENRVLSKIFGPKREEVRGDWIQFYIEEFIICTAYYSRDQI